MHILPKTIFSVAITLAAGGMVSAEPITAARVADALPKLEALAKKTVEEGGVPGLAIAVVYKDELVYLKGFGLREVGKPELVDGDTVFQLASLSKPISSTVVATLVSDGTISWDSRIADLDPAFALRDAYPTRQVTCAICSITGADFLAARATISRTSASAGKR